MVDIEASFVTFFVTDITNFTVKWQRLVPNRQQTIHQMSNDDPIQLEIYASTHHEVLSCIASYRTQYVARLYNHGLPSRTFSVTYICDTLNILSACWELPDAGPCYAYLICAADVGTYWNKGSTENNLSLFCGVCRVTVGCCSLSEFTW